MFRLFLMLLLAVYVAVPALKSSTDSSDRSSSCSTQPTRECSIPEPINLRRRGECARRALRNHDKIDDIGKSSGCAIKDDLSGISDLRSQISDLNRLCTVQ